MSRVLLVVLEDFPGSENRVQRQAAALRDSGWDVRVLAARGTEEVSSWEGIQVSRTWCARKKAGSTARRLWEYTAFPIECTVRILAGATRCRPDVIQVASMPDWLVFSAVPARWFWRVPIVLDLHELMPELMSAKGGGGFLTKLLSIIERWCVRAADVVLVPTPACRELLMARNPEANPVLVLNAVDTSRFEIVDPSSHRRLGNRLLVGYHGTLAPRFGVASVIKALSLMRSAGIDVRFEVYGDGAERGALEALSGSLGLEDAVMFHGQVPAAQLRSIIPSFDMGVVPLVDDEFTRIAYPTKLFEYIASGVPVVASDIASVRELFSDSAITFAAPGDPSSWCTALSTLWADEGAAVDRAKAAQAELGKYVWSALSGAYIKTLADAVGAGTQAGPNA